MNFGPTAGSWTLLLQQHIVSQFLLWQPEIATLAGIRAAASASPSFTLVSQQEVTDIIKKWNPLLVPLNHLCIIIHQFFDYIYNTYFLTRTLTFLWRLTVLQFSWKLPPSNLSQTRAQLPELPVMFLRGQYLGSLCIPSTYPPLSHNLHRFSFFFCYAEKNSAFC